MARKRIPPVYSQTILCVPHQSPLLHSVCEFGYVLSRESICSFEVKWMKKYRQAGASVMIAASMIFLICNAERSLGFATEAVEMCVTSLIPSLFPFMFFSTLLSSVLMGCHFRSFRILSKLCRIPNGSEILLILGSLGGYPVGAQMISNAYQNGQLKREDAQRILGFCNNAGPAFIFGILGPAFESGIIPALLWLIQIISAVITAWRSTSPLSAAVKIWFRCAISGAFREFSRANRQKISVDRHV